MKPAENHSEPLASRMRPRNLDEFHGQTHLTAKGKPLQLAIERGQLHSMILWGPPGSGKTTLAKIIANETNASIEFLSAVFSGVKDIRASVDKAKQQRAEGTATVLFIDEIHRFNKSQQDAFLPFVEDGTITLIGATTENPSFELNNALLSRSRVYMLKRLEQNDLIKIIDSALEDYERGLGSLNLNFPPELRSHLTQSADGDARQALIFLDIIAEYTTAQTSDNTVTESILQQILTDGITRFDKRGEAFYDEISALHKSVRGSSPDAALYWLSRMLLGGCDPLYIARRVLRMASEDIGNADPRGLTIAVNALETYERLGSPEGELAIAQAVAYLACAPKSNAIYTAFNLAQMDAKNYGSLPVPIHLRNAPTRLMRELGYGKDYRYAHDEKDAFAVGEKYFPPEMDEKIYYNPVPRGLEIKIAEVLNYFRELNKKK